MFPTQLLEDQIMLTGKVILNYEESLKKTAGQVF